MIFHATVLVIFASFNFAGSENVQGFIHGTQGLKIYCDTQENLDYILSLQHMPGFDFHRISRDKDIPTNVFVTPHHLQKFKNDLSSRDIKYQVFIDDVGKLVNDVDKPKDGLLTHRQKRGQASFLFDRFPSYDEIKSYVLTVSKKHHDIAKTFSIGKTFEGRDIIAIKISSGGEDKPALVIDAGLHAQEWLAPTTALYVIQQLTENATNSYIFQNIDIYVIPSLNPDGYEFSRESDENRLWKKTRSVQANSTCRGVNGNRNFDFAWMVVGASSDPCSPYFAGSKPFSELETQALRDFLFSLKNVKVYLTLHTFGNFFLHPWSYTTELPKNVSLLRCVGNKAEAALSKIRGTHYKVGTSPELFTPSGGSSDDWALAKGGAELSYTMELPSESYGYIAPINEIIPVGEESFEAIKVFAKYTEGINCENL